MFQSWDTSLTCAGYTKDTDTLQKVHGWGEAGKGEVCSPCLPWEKVLKAEGGCALTIRVCSVAEDTVEVRIQKSNKELPNRLLAFLSLSPQAPRACTGELVSTQGWMPAGMCHSQPVGARGKGYCRATLCAPRLQKAAAAITCIRGSR